MSYFIETHRAVVKIPTSEIAHEDHDRNRFAEPKYLFLSRGGDNNLIDNDTNAFSKAWSVIAAGSIHDCMRKIVETSQHCEGGGIKYVNGDVKPENFIKAYRKEIKNSLTLEQFNNAFGSSDLKAVFKEKEMLGHSGKKFFVELLERYKGTPEESFLGMPPTVSFKIPINSPQNLFDIFEAAKHAAIQSTSSLDDNAGYVLSRVNQEKSLNSQPSKHTGIRGRDLSI